MSHISHIKPLDDGQLHLYEPVLFILHLKSSMKSVFFPNHKKDVKLGSWGETSERQTGGDPSSTTDRQAVDVE